MEFAPAAYWHDSTAKGPALVGTDLFHLFLAFVLVSLHGYFENRRGN